MNSIQKYKKIREIIQEVVKENKEKELNDLKRLVKNEIRSLVGEEEAQSITIEYIMQIVRENKNYVYNETREQNNKAKRIDEREGER